MLLSVVTVNWNSREDLSECLASLERQSFTDFEVIVVDNGSEDGSVPMVRERYPRVHLLPQAENLGFAEGCNRGIRESRGQWAVMLNNDAVAEPTWAASLAQAAETASQRCGMLQCQMLFRARPGTINSTGIVLRRSGRGSDRDEGRPRDAREADEIFCPTAGAAAYRRTMLDEVRLDNGWFDASYFCYLEDLDLGWRARLAGWEARFVPESVVLHAYHGSTERRGRRWIRSLSIPNHFRTLAKNASTAMQRENYGYCAMEWFELLRLGGLGAWRDAKAAVREAEQRRAQVDAVCRVEREVLERRWLGVESGGASPLGGSAA